MLKMLQTTFWKPVGRPLLKQIKALGFDGVRIDLLPTSVGVETELDCVTEALTAGLLPLIIVRDAHQLLRLVSYFGQDARYELENEPDIGFPGRRGPIHPNEYRVLMAEAASVAQAYGVILYVGAITNPIIHEDKRGLRYLGSVMGAVDYFPDVRVSLHWYRHGKGQDVHPQFTSLDHELDEFKRVIGPRAWACSETGDSTALEEWTTGFWFWKKRHRAQLSDIQVAARAIERYERFKRHGADFMVWYQLNDGPQWATERLDAYGIRYYGDHGIGGPHWKPVAGIWQNA